jgi:hypothetical protein
MFQFKCFRHPGLLLPKGNSIDVMINAIICVILMGYKEYRIDHVVLKKHLPELTAYSMYTTGIFYVYILFSIPENVPK